MNRYNITGALYPPDNKLIYALIFGLIVLVHGFINQFQVPNMDEIWNYQFARRILYGQIPYRDFLMLNTPLSAQINALMLYLFSDKLIVMRWVAAFIAGLNGVVFFVTLRLIGKTLVASLLYTSILVLLFLLNPQNNYSWYAVLFLSLALLLEVIRLNRAGDSDKRAYDLLIGVFLGLSIMTKQNIGMAALIAALLFNLFENSLYRREGGASISALFSSMLLKMVGTSIPIIAEILWLRSNQSLHAFANTFDNISNFTSINHFAFWFQSSYTVSLLAVLSILALVSFSQVFNWNNGVMERQLYMLLSLYALANCAMIYPMPDPAHIWFGMPLFVIAFGVTSVHLLSKAIGRAMVYCVLTVILILLLMPFQNLNKHDNYNLKHYELIPLHQELYKSTVTINDYILNQERSGKNVFFLNYQAPRFLIPLDKFGYRYDTLLTGDLGFKGENDVIEKLANADGAVVLIAGIPSERHRFESQAIQDYVRNNMQYTDHMYGFDIYTR